VREILKKMIVLNPKNREDARKILEDRYFSNFLSSERDIGAFYERLAEKHPLMLELDDNLLYELKYYEEGLMKIIELDDKKDMNLLMTRRFRLKEAFAEPRESGQHGESRERERGEQSNVDIRSNLSPPKQLQDEDADELEGSRGTDGAPLSHGKNSLKYRPED
jgi:hypothetical protein